MNNNWKTLQDISAVKSIPGIYIIYSKTSKKYYIGETFNIKKRINEHIKLNTQLIHKIIKKRGIDDFLYYVEYFPYINKQDLLIMEEYLISKYNSLVPNGYNICSRGIYYSINKPRIVSDITRKKISNANKGKKISDITKKKMSDAKKGKSRSKEHQNKITIANTGKKRSQIIKDKISKISKNRSTESNKKISLSNKGKKRSIETKEKLSKSLLGHIVSEETRRKISESCKGKIISIETRKKMSDARKANILKKKLKEQSTDDYSNEKIIN